VSKTAVWRNIFRHREKVAVRVGGKTELLTDTQSYRFDEISDVRASPDRTTCRNPLEDARYKLADAAFRLMISEDEILAKAAAGGLHLYVDAAGKSGYWCRQDREGIVSRSSVMTIGRGLLKLRSRACTDLARHGRAIVRALDQCLANDNSQVRLDDATAANLRAWGPGHKQFLPLHPLTIERDMVILLPPLNSESRC